MTRRVLDRVSYANVVATIALFLALGGAAYAKFKLPADSVRSTNIVNGQIKSSDVGNNKLTGKDIRESTLTGDAIAVDYRRSTDDAGTKLFKLGPWKVTASCVDLNPSQVVEFSVKGPASFETTSQWIWVNNDPVDDGPGTTGIPAGVTTPLFSLAAASANYKHEYGVYFVRTGHTVAEFNLHSFANGTGDGACSIVGTATLGSTP